MANHILSKNYHEGFIALHHYINIDTIKDKELSNFCKKFKIENILCQGINTQARIYQLIPEDSTIIFQRKNTPFIGSKRDIIVDCSQRKKNYPNHPPSYGWELIKIDSEIYYYKH